MNTEGYVLITAARNEGKYIKNTLDSVVSQTILPKKWVIISDNSTDFTDDIVRSYAKEHEYITLVYRDSDQTRDFASKVNAIAVGYKELEGTDFSFMGILDADIQLEADYYSQLLERFSAEPELGMAGGTYWEEKHGEFQPSGAHRSRNVPGGIQTFRKNCFEEIGGLLPLRFGGEDTVAGIMARMIGWKVHSFSELRVKHLRPVGTAGSGILLAKFREGRMDRGMGYHPLYEFSKFLRRLIESPFLVASCVRLGGYFWSILKDGPIGVPDDVVRYIRTEQLIRLRILPKQGSGRGGQ